MYAKHRNSGSFLEEEARKKMKRDHPVNANLSNSDLIDANYMIDEINRKMGKFLKSRLF